MTRQQKRKQERDNHKMTVYIKTTRELPKRSVELNNQLVEASIRMLRTFREIKEQLNLNEERTNIFFQFVVNANNEFMKNPNTTVDTYKSFEEIMWSAAKRTINN